MIRQPKAMMTLARKNCVSDQDGEAFFAAVQKAIDHGGARGTASASAAFHAAAEHVLVLLADSVEMFRRKSFGTSVFLAITAMEESAKAEIVAFRVQSPIGESKPKRDPLRDHRQKHLIAIRPTTFMGRLPAILGPDACSRLQGEAAAGALSSLRESALYVHVDERGVTVPSIAIGHSRAREILFLALECADDILIGWTNVSFGFRKRLEPWFAEIVSHAPDHDA